MTTQVPQIGVVLLSMGNRMAELGRALAALERQQGVELDVVLVGNGWRPEGVPDWVRTHYEPENLGVPGGRNLGASLVSGEYLFFYDDDGELPDVDTLLRLTKALTPGVAIVQPRGVDPEGKPTPRRWVPRLKTNGELQAGSVAVFWEAMAMMRRSAFDQVGGWPGEFFFGHEGIDLAMRLLDAGWRIRFEPEITVLHPAHPAARHAVYYRTNARNRAWVARRNLPTPLQVIYLGVWVGATIVRVRRPAALREWFGGLREGLSGPVPGGDTQSSGAPWR